MCFATTGPTTLSVRCLLPVGRSSNSSTSGTKSTRLNAPSRSPFDFSGCHWAEPVFDCGMVHITIWVDVRCVPWRTFRDTQRPALTEPTVSTPTVPAETVLPTPDATSRQGHESGNGPRRFVGVATFHTSSVLSFLIRVGIIVRAGQKGDCCPNTPDC